MAFRRQNVSLVDQNGNPLSETNNTLDVNAEITNEILETNARLKDSAGDDIDGDNPVPIVLYDNLGNLIEDGTTSSIKTITYEHHEIHSSNHYFYQDYTTLNSAAKIDFGIQTTNTTKWIHLTWEIISQGKITFQIYEDALITFNGTDLKSWNNNRNSGNVSNMVKFQSNPTINNTPFVI